MHLFLWAEDSADALHTELAETFPGMVRAQASWLEADFDLGDSQRLPTLAFARQWLPNALPVFGESVRSWAGRLFDAVTGELPDEQPWSLHVLPHYGVTAVHRMGARAWHSRTRQSGSARRLDTTGEAPARVSATAGRQRCHLITEATLELLRQKRRHLLRRLRSAPATFTAQDSLVQLVLTAPDTGFLSVAKAPVPFEQRHLLSAFPKGTLPVAADAGAPSRAFAKLLEAEQRLGRSIQAGETCADLGAAPGSWTYVAVNRGARVCAVDRSGLRADLMQHPLVEVHTGDAFGFQPRQPVDWLLCDIIAPAERSADLLLQWLQRGWCRQFVVTLKLQDSAGLPAVARLKRELPSLASDWFLTRLCANKKELCAFGWR